MRTWLEINFIIMFTYIAFSLFRILFNTNGKYSFENDTFKALGLMGLFPILINFIPIDDPFSPIIKKQVAASLAPSIEKLSAITFQMPQEKITSAYSSFGLSEALFGLIFIGVIIWLVRFTKDMMTIRKMIKDSVLIKRISNVSMYLCPDLKVPCSFWIPSKYFVLFPESVLLDKKLFSHALSHELQHHRQGDTKLIYLMELLRAIFYLNPFTHLWINRIHENRELKCDKEVLSRRGYEASEYGSTLIDVVKISSGIVLKRTWAMASLTKIKRRIEMITITKKGQFDWPKRFVCIALTMFVGWQALASTRNLTGLKVLSLNDAEELASTIDSKIPIEVNDTVLKWLNYFMGDPKGKAFITRSLQRMLSHEDFLKEKLKQNNMPIELLAVPLMESGFSNTVVSSAKAAGIWQFVPGTARKYGLKVNSRIDERFNVDKLTNAAIAYYSDLMNISHFDKDWRLALIAYNSGENRLIKAIKKQGTKDPWAFNNVGDSEYLAKIVAGMIILKNQKKRILSTY